jgi:glycosyltransferase involved in cell wall biosynthesis
MSRPIHILALFDYNSITGFSTVSNNLVKTWKTYFGDDLHMDIVAINYFGEDYSDGNNIRVISAKEKDIAKDDFGRYAFLRSMRDKNYDLIFILQDLGVVSPMVKFIKEAQNEQRLRNKGMTFKSVFYFPVDFSLLPSMTSYLDFFDYLATFTEYGKTQVLKLNSKVAKKLNVIPHGNNMEHFDVIPKEDALAFRKEYFGKNADKFIVTNINRNQSRKDIPTTIFGFLEYWEEYNKNSFLYLHMHPNDPMGWNLRTILAQTPLVEGRDFMFNSELENHRGASRETIKNIYNASDVYLSTATGGGWELPVTEAMACKLPCVIPNHTSLGELGANGKRAYMLNTLYPISAMVDNIIRFQSDLYEIAETIDLVKKQKDSNSLEYTNRINSAYDFVSGLKWDDIAKTFAKGIRLLTN